MNNPTIARLFEEIADFLEILEENPFRIRSYRKAAQTIEGLPREIREMDEKKWRDVPGVGESIAAKIKEFLNTGKCQLHEELKAKLPSTLLEMTRIPGLGPKTTHKLFFQLGIDSLDSLEMAAKAQKIRVIKGLGPKIEEKILKGIAYKREYKARHHLGRVYPLALLILEAIKEKAPVNKLALAGSIRRMKETVADIDILVSSKKSEAVMKVFTALPLVKEILAAGPTKSSILTSFDIQVDLRVVDEDSFGAALHYFTGSAAHNIKIREMAQKKGLKVSEYGVFKEKDGKRIAGRKEEEVFEIVGLPWIPPELREDRGEFESALKGTLPSLIEIGDIKGDLHAHTNWSDGVNTILEMAQAAQDFGYEYLSISDHTKALGVAGGLDSEDFLKQWQEIEKTSQKFKKLKLLRSAEVDILADGSLDLPDDILKNLDIVVASIHSKFNMPEEEMTKRIIKAMENRYVNIIAHPTGRLIGTREPYAVNMGKLIEAAKQTGTWLEINAYWDRLDLSDLHSRQAKDNGVSLVISTDAHNTNGFQNLKYGVATARRGWLEKKNVVNTLPINDLMALVKAKRVKSPPKILGIVQEIG